MISKFYRKTGRTLLCVLAAAALAFTNGAGNLTQADLVFAEGEISISTAEDLQKIGTDNAFPLSGSYVLENDIDMAGIAFTPIGGGAGERGASSGTNVFTGRFDGQGHVISNLSIQKTESSSVSWQYGMFGMIGSDDAGNPASVKNLILAGVDICVDMTASQNDAYLSAGGLAGAVNHNAVIDNVALVGGTVQGNPSDGGDVVGVGGLIGEMRYSVQNTGSSNNVSISNVYVSADVSSGGSKDSNYAAGLIGRIAYTNPSSLTSCVFTGNVTFKGSNGYGISGGTMTSNISHCYYLSGKANTGTAMTKDQLNAGTLPDGLSGEYWSAEEGKALMPLQCTKSEAVMETIVLSELSPVFSKGDSLSSVTGNFTVPMSITIGNTEETITWTCDKDVISVQADGTAAVSEVFADTDCILTATTASGKEKKFSVTIKGVAALSIDQEYAQVGQPLTATLSGAPSDLECTYEWSVGGTVKSREASYTPASEDLEQELTVKVTVTGDYAGTYSASMYISKLPVIYINTENFQAITSKETYINGGMKIQGNGQYHSGNTTLYDGEIEIRGRGNTTWSYDKKPYKVKLGTKTDLFGFGSNKHWVLLANYTDESHLRNTLSYNLSGAMGMPYMQSVHVDLVLNGVYQGTYQFCEQVKTAKARVNIHDWEDYASDVAKAVVKAEDSLTKDADQDAIETQLAEEDLTWLTTKKFTYKDVEYTITDYLDDMPDMTGGFLIELDSYYDEVSKFKTSKNQPLQFKNPEFIATSTDAMKYVQTYINAFESAIDAGDYTTEYNGETVTYSQLFDMDSLVQYWLVNELFMNVDAMKKSTYMYKDIDGLFHMGPIWDMDWSSNSLVSNSQGSGTYNTWQTTKFSDEAQANQWYKSIIKDPYFAVQAYELYQQMKEYLDEIVAENGTMDTYQELLLESANANADKWYTSSGNNNWGGGWQGGNRQDKTFTTQMTTLKTYLANRIDWLDTQFASPETLASSLGYAAAGGITVEEEDITIQESGAATISAAVTDSSVAAVEFLVNGVKTGSIAVEDGTAVIEAPASALKAADSYNTIQVFGLNASGAVITSGNKTVTDFAVFQTAKGDENTPGGDDNNPGGDDNNPGGNDNNPGGNDNNPGGDDNNPGEDDNNPGGGDDNTPGEDDNNPGGDGNTPGGGSGDGSSSGENNNSNGNNNGGNAVSGVTAVTFARKTITVPKGTSAALEVTITAQDGADKTVTYTSSDSSVVQVSNSGEVKGRKKGTAVITATAGKVSDTCTVTVSEVTLNVTSAPMQKKQTTTAVQIKSSYPENDTVASWNSSKPSVASVSKSGKITAKKTGTAVITVTMKSGAKASCKIKVSKGTVKTTRVSLNKKKLSLKKGKSFQIKLARTPVTANDKVTYSVQNKKIAKVTSKGKIKALKKGSTKVTVKAGSKKVKINVTVK
ncbi:MAG: hypothetical protein HFJ04_03610 [Lachnospiraceae bacterium]|nr:hypothetical protein [Lachnospiraceae bacterium]